MGAGIDQRWCLRTDGRPSAVTVSAILRPASRLNESHGNSIYHSFQLKIEKRYSKGLYMLVAYTNSKLNSDASDNTQQLGGSWNATQGVISPYEQRRARTVSSDDVPQILSAAFVYDLPFGKGQRYANRGGAVNALVGGWQLSPLIHLQSGTPMWFRSTSCQVVPQFRQNCLVGLVPGVNPFLQDINGYDPGKGPCSTAPLPTAGIFLRSRYCSGVHWSLRVHRRWTTHRNIRGRTGRTWISRLPKTRIGERGIFNFALLSSTRLTSITFIRPLTLTTRLEFRLRQ